MVPEHFNIAEACLISHAREWPDAVAIMDFSGGARIWTYGEIAQAAEKLAGLWQSQGVQKGDRVAILLPQCAETMIAHFTAHLMGAISVPLFVLFGPDALQYRLADSGAKIVVTDRTQYPKICEIRQSLPELEQVFLRDGEDEGALGLWGSLEASHAPRLSVKALAEDPAMMIYTSGTTGSPKGVLHAHRFLLGHLPCLELSFADFPNSTDVGWTPADWAWIGGLMDMVVPCFYYRVPLVAKRFDRFTAQAAFTLIRDAQVTRAFLPPTALKMMRQGEVPKDARLVSISSGGEPLSADLIAWAKTALGAEVNELYGQTECNLSAGSARAQGFLQFVARDDDLITASGYRIGPTEIEATLAQDPRVIMAAVVAAPDPTRGHVIGAYVTVSKSPEIGFEQDLIAKVAKQLSPHMAPKWVRIVAEMPMTATGKIRHVALREMAARAPAPEQTAG